MLIHFAQVEPRTGPRTSNDCCLHFKRLSTYICISVPWSGPWQLLDVIIGDLWQVSQSPAGRMCQWVTCKSSSSRTQLHKEASQARCGYNQAPRAKANMNKKGYKPAWLVGTTAREDRRSENRQSRCSTVCCVRTHTTVSHRACIHGFGNYKVFCELRMV